MSRKLFFHFLALLTALVWGSTFAVSKVLLNNGLSPAGIMTLRFLTAYFLMLSFAHKNIISKSVRDELKFALCGITGGSLYFLAENTAVEMTSASSTVALLVCLTPLFTAVANFLLHKDEKLSKRFLLGSFIALGGTALVVFNGVFVLDDNPAVIFLSLAAGLCWTVYSLILRGLENDYSSDTITRKVFFWGVLTMCLYFLFFPKDTSAETLLKTEVMFSLLFLAVVASLGCYLVWNMVLKRIGVVTASNYLFFNPVSALVTANLVLDERITLYAIAGCVLIVIGVYLCNKHDAKICKSNC